MFDRISTFLTDTLIEGGTLKSEERSLYIYCFGTMLETAANLLSAIIIGALLGEFPAALIFMLVFIPLRSMAGGFHCNSAGGSLPPFQKAGKYDPGRIQERKIKKQADGKFLPVGLFLVLGKS